MSSPTPRRVSLDLDVVHLLRHGEVHNPQGMLYGRLPDFHLSQRGRAMARMVADHLRDEPIGMVTASSLDRAQETAAPIAGAHGLGVHTDDRVIEAGNHFEGKRFGHAEGSLKHPPNWPLLINPLQPSWGSPTTASRRGCSPRSPPPAAR